MVELTPSKTSRPRMGLTWPKPKGASSLRKFQNDRLSADDGESLRGK